STNIDEVVPEESNDFEEEPEISIETPEEPVEEKQEVQEEPEIPIEKPKEEIKTKVKSKKHDKDSLKSDKKIIMIAGIIALILVIIVLILFTTKKKPEKAYPVIKLVGEETIILDVDAQYKELGYFALDQEDGDITDKVTIVGEVDTSKPGIYQIKYKVLDNDLMKTELYRNVIVKSKKNDFDFTINGSEIVFINPNAEFVEEGYKVTYNGTDISNEVKVFGSIDRQNPGSYNLVYAISKDNQVAALKRTIVVYKGEEMDASADLITELNNWIIDELHYSNKISIDNISTSALLYFGVLNCHDDKNEIRAKELNECLSKVLMNGQIKIPVQTKYKGALADITYNSTTQSWTINKLDLPKPKDDLYKVVVDNDTIYLYELYGYGVALNNREICDGNDNKVYYSGVDRNTLLGYESCKIVNGETIRTKNYKMSLYMHTFKVNNGKYYWQSTEMIK
ncbi:MAG: DUF5011 domain-containing protein, partial [Bacilli bacterium]|nr:DUF5011 domain-containing protein [Bacilli bacterium]